MASDASSPLPKPGSITGVPYAAAEAPPIVPDHQLLRCVGKGAFGEVWLARTALGSFRAVKVVHRAAFDDPSDYERELAGVRRFEPISRSHEGLVDLLHVGVNDADGYFYYAMELADAAPGHIDSVGLEQVDGAPAPPSAFNPESYSPLTLSARLRSTGRLPLDECLRVGVALTDALQFLHEQDLIHRDIKPSNIIFVSGAPKLADIGTVTRVDDAKTMVGTEGFQAPEGPGKPQADLYSLGKVLYEMCTGKDRHRFPEPLTQLPDLPDRAQWQEFNAVVDKACQPEPTRRYLSAAELRADLVTLQAGRSVRRQWRLQKRFKQFVWASAAAILLAALVLYIQYIRLQVTSQRAGESERGRALLELERVILPPHEAGWSSNAWFMASNAAARFGFDSNLQSQASASLAGLDATPLFQAKGIGGSSVAFARDGKRILFGSLPSTDRTSEPGKVHLLDLDPTKLTAFPAPGAGPVAFLPDGTPVQFSADTNNRLALWLVQPGTPPEAAESAHPSALRYFTLANDETITNVCALAMTSDGAFVAVSGVTSSNRAVCSVWSRSNGERRLVVDSNSTNALALTPDGTFLAVGDDNGVVTLWRASSASPAPGATPTPTPFARIIASRLPISSLAFGRDFVFDPLRPPIETPWLLAVGDSGGGLAIWEALRQNLRTRCLGSYHNRLGLSFSPDGTLLASAGRGPVVLWDTATGSQILSMESGDYINGIGFAQQGSKLAVASEGKFKTATLSAWALDASHGVTTLRGLGQQITRVYLSQDARLAAALTVDWQVGIWSLAPNRLVGVFTVPRGTFTADNASLVFSADNSHFAFISGEHAMLVELKTGKRANEWRLPPGYVDELALTRSGRLLAFHLESANVSAATFTRPTTARIWELCADNGRRLLQEIPEFNQQVHRAFWAPDGSFVVADGETILGDRTTRSVKAISPLDGKVLWTQIVDVPPDWGCLVLDTAGQIAAVRTNAERAPCLLEAATGRFLRELTEPILALDSSADLALASARAGVLRLESLAGQSPMLLISPGGSRRPEAVLNCQGDFLALGNPDGTVTVYDVRQMQRRLGQIRLSWRRPATSQPSLH